MSFLEKLPLPLGLILFVPLAPLFMLLAFFARGSKRRLPPEPSEPKLVRGTDFLVPQEHVDEGEDELFDDIVDGVVREMKKNYAKGSGADYPNVVDDGHGGNVAMLRGTLEVTAEHLEALPEPLRVGLFEKPATYDLLARFNYTDIANGPVEATRVSLKIEGPEGREIDLLLAAASRNPDDEEAFFLRDATDMAFLGGMPRTLLSPNGMRQMHRVVIGNLNRNNKYAKEVQRKIGPFGQTYTSATPYRLGPACIIWRLRANQEHPVEEPTDASQNRTVKMHELAATYCKSDRELSFTLAVRVATAKGTAGPIRCVEENDVPWDNAQCPLLDVADVRFEAGQWNARLEELGDPGTWSHHLRFNAANTLDVHAPLGSNNRLRKMLYARHSQSRLEHQHGLSEPTLKCPFDHASA